MFGTSRLLPPCLTSLRSWSSTPLFICAIKFSLCSLFSSSVRSFLSLYQSMVSPLLLIIVQSAVVRSIIVQLSRVFFGCELNFILFLLLCSFMCTSMRRFRPVLNFPSFSSRSIGHSSLFILH